MTIRILGRGLLGLAVLACACGRRFEPPPPVPAVGEFAPAHGFAGDEIEIQVENPGTEGELAVFFGTAKAEILPRTEGDGGIRVRVPVLQTGSRVVIQVSTSGGQADTGERLFVYDGHGHPLQQRVVQERSSRANPRCVFTAPELPLGFFGYINGNSNQLGLAQEDLSLHADTGLCVSPLSAGVSNSPEDATGAQFWISGLEPGLSLDDPQPSKLLRARVQVDLANATVELGGFQELDFPGSGDPFVPLFVETICANMACLAYRVVVTDGLHSRVALFDPVPMDQTPVPEILDLGAGAASLCAPARAPGAFFDLCHDRPSGDLYAAAGDSPEIWQLPTGGGTAERVWPADPQDINCGQTILSISINPSRERLADPLRLFAAYLSPPIIRSLQRVGGTWVEMDARLVDGVPFSLTAGQFEDESGAVIERLYAMTSNGLRGFDVSDGGLDPVLSIPEQVAIGWPQALGTDDKYGSLQSRPDTILWADEEGDRLVTWQAGHEREVSHTLPLANLAPSLARSPSQPYDYLADLASNAIRVLDRDSAAQVGQFGIAGNQVYGADLSTFQTGSMDLLLIPGHGTGGALHSGLQLRRIDGDAALPDCAPSLVEGRADDPDSLFLFADEDHYDFFAAAARPEPLLVFVRNKSAGQPGRLWTRSLDAQASALDASIVGQRANELDVPVRIKLLGTDTDEQVMALVPGLDSDDTSLLVIDVPEQRVLRHELSELHRQLAQAVAVKKTRDPDSGQARYTVYLAMGQLGTVRALTLDPDGGQVSDFAVSTGGRPSGLVISPDRRRLYANHLTHGLLSIFDIEDVEPGPDLESMLDLDVYPYKVIFTNDGGQAVVLHLYTGHQTVIE
ncbi:MAG: hypothetical protein JXR96_11835 [Deltaproteobacteria bacterium]|nr:hypothetical protein [Deltaproteobacteria bacterium]